MDIAKYNNCKTWLQEPGTGNCEKSLICEDLYVIDDIKLGRCIKASCSIPKGNDIINIPKKYLLNYITILMHLSKYNDEIDSFLENNIHNFSNKTIGDNIIVDDITKFYSVLKLDALLSLSSHQLIMIYICLEKLRGHNSFWFPLISCFPDFDEFNKIPISWIQDFSSKCDKENFEQLPMSTISYVTKQDQQFKTDLKVSTNLLNNIDTRLTTKCYLWSWLVVNTRCLYYTLPKYLPIAQTKDAKSSNITMVPFVDLVNHITTEANCSARETKNGYCVSTLKTIEKDKHLWFTYGPHDDEMLQCEYGFHTSELNFKNNQLIGSKNLNTFNYVDISSIISKLLKSPKKQNAYKWLKQVGYYDDYTLGIENVEGEKISSKPSYRTRIALASLIENDDSFVLNKPERFIQCPMKLDKFYNGYNNGEYYLKSETLLLKKIVSKVKDKINGKIEKLQVTDDKTAMVRDLLCLQNILLDQF